jgi:hypothetical protein
MEEEEKDDDDNEEEEEDEAPSKWLFFSILSHSIFI